jgi:3-methyladenine DNA glycosylase AlkC
MNLTKMSISDNCRIASDENTSPETLAVLANDKHWYIRCSVASNPNTAPQTLELLAQDENSYVRYWVARNPNTTEEIFLMVKAYEKFKHLVLK